MDWKGIVRGIAPVLGTALGGPLAGGALKVLGDKLLGKPDAKEEDIAAFVTQARPEDLVALKTIETEYKTKMAELGLDPLRLEYQDRASARDLFKVDNKPQRNIAYWFLGGYFTILAAMLIYPMFTGKELPLPKNFEFVFGVITAAVPQILAFFYGSTSSSSQKNALLAASAPPATTGP